MKKTLEANEVFSGILDKLTFLQKSFRAVGCGGCTEEFMAIGIGFYFGAARILEEIQTDLDELSSEYTENTSEEVDQGKEG